jgi:hypothetical protein
MLAPRWLACSTNAIFELMTRCSFQGIPYEHPSAMSWQKSVSDVVAPHHNV